MKPPCRNCGHSPHWHRFDDDKLTLTHNAMSPDAEFRCLGEEFNGCKHNCPNYTSMGVTS